MFAAANVEKVIRHLVRFGSTPTEAEDLAQEALLIAWRKKADLEQDRPLDAWLFGIARNVYRNHARSVRRNPIADLGDRAADGAEPARPLADVLAVRAALQALP
ncbi:MAG: RNA polymerase subunit sigma-24, partial [Deltaproteobacteria bacterium]|nr:RNA polymerase subunit sigma-24 [Deltaproteobacteria bacterium]